MTVSLVLLIACSNGGKDSVAKETDAPIDTADSVELVETGDSDAVPVDTCPIYDTAEGGPVVCDRTVPWKSVAAGWNQTCGIHTDGCAECWGIGIEESQPEEYVDRYHYRCEDRPPPADYASIVMMREDTYGFGQHACGLTTSGEAVCWGEDSNQELDVPSGPWVGVALWQFGTYLVAADGSVWAGDGAFVPDGEIRAITIGESCMALRSDGTVVAFDERYGAGPEFAGPYSSIDHYYDFCGITTSGGIECWDGGSSWIEPAASIMAEAPTSGVEQVCVHEQGGACVLLDDGVVDCLGGNSVAPGDPDAAERFSSIACGYGHVCGVTTDGRLLCWGEDEYGETLVPT